MFEHNYEIMKSEMKKKKEKNLLNPLGLKFIYLYKKSFLNSWKFLNDFVRIMLRNAILYVEKETGDLKFTVFGSLIDL